MTRTYKIGLSLLVFQIIATAASAQVSVDGKLALKPEGIQYAALPGGPIGVVSAVPVGALGLSGVYVLRNYFPPNYTLNPHTHAQWRVMTVLEGTLYFGYGDVVDEAKMQAFGPGSLIIEPKGTPHYFRTGNERVLLQFVAEGPLTTAFVGQ